MNSSMIKSLSMAVLMTMLCTGCAMFGRGNQPSSMLSSGPVSEENREAQLRELVQESLSADQRADSASKARLVQRRPYFFREYVSYPEGISNYELTTAATDSKSSPYVATVRLAKERHATSLEKKRNRADEDGKFYASKGYETRSYELRHGRWRETGSVYIVEEGDPVPASKPVASAGSSTQSESRTGLRRLLFWRD